MRRVAYQQLVEEWNPERLQTRDEILFDDGFSETQMKWLNAAYAVLMNPVQREQHNLEILTALESQGQWAN